MSPKTHVSFDPELRGHIELLSHRQVKGWAAEIKDGQCYHPNLSIFVNGKAVGRIKPSDYRSYLKEGGIGDGTFGFTFGFPEPIRSDAVVEVISDDGGKLNMSPKTFINFAPKFHDLVIQNSDFNKSDLMAAHRIALYVSFSSTGTFYDYQRAQIAELQSAGYYVIGIHAANESSNNWLDSRLCDVDIFKSNVGYDFGSWSVGVQWLDQFAGDYERRLDALLLMNDSCFGTISAKKIETLSHSPGELIGISDSFQIEYHIQSYFLLCRGNPLQRGDFCQFLRDYIFPERKKDVIQYGEILLSKRLVNAGVDISATCEYNKLASLWLEKMHEKLEREKAIYQSLGFTSAVFGETVDAQFFKIMTALLRGKPLNPSHVFWEEILQLDVSLVKRELLLTNPADVPNYFSLCQTCIRTGIVSPDELQQYVSHERKPSLTASFLRMVSGVGTVTSVDS